MNQNGNHDRVAVVETTDHQTNGNGKSTSFYDPAHPVLKPANPLDTGRKKSWKRRLFSLSLGLIFIGGVFVALYLLLRVNRVNVRVDADSRREQTAVKPKTDGGNSESELTTEAIDMARRAAGADNARSEAVPSPSPNASPIPSPSYVKTNYSYTGNSSPTNEAINNEGNGNGNQQNGAGNAQQVKSVESLTEATMQSHANSTVSLFVDDAQPKSSPSPQTVSGMKINSRLNNSASSSVPRIPPAVLPPFGTMLPVRTQGVIFSLRDNSYARLELMRDCSGPGWSLPKGTVFIGRTSGSNYDRAFVNVIGYVDPRENKLVKITGDVLGSDGATGIQGKSMGVDRNRLKQTLRKVASSGLQVAGVMSGALGRGTVILDRSGYRLPDEVRGLSGARSDRNAFVKVAAGQSAYVMIADLPKPMQAVDAPGDDEVARAAVSLTDREVMELILFGSPEDIRAATPMMTEEQKKLVLKTLTPEDEKR
ncbi:MAG TPA: hypothetical protein VE863_01645 [Pyrinomonadaceae bacterium]|nr:hypothetical protein [Pyrinomonadaceae bacterium]